MAKRIFITGAILMVVICGGAAAQLSKFPQNIVTTEIVTTENVLFRPRQIIVEIRPEASIAIVNERNRTRTLRRVYGTNFYKLEIPPGTTEDKARIQLSKDPDVLSATLNPVVNAPYTSLSRSIMSFPDGYPQPGATLAQYNQQVSTLNSFFGLGQSHQRSTGGSITVAVIDTGLDRTHPVFAGRLWQDNRVGGDTVDLVDNDLDSLVDDTFGWDFVDNDADPNESAGDPATTVAGHGTFIGGLIAMMAPGCKIMPIRAFSPIGESDEFMISEAIKWATDHGADVLNLSFGSPTDSRVLRGAIQYAFQRNVSLIAAVGNENTSTPPQYPANITNQVMGVAALDYLDVRTFFSNYGGHVSVSAPGLALVSAYPGNSYATWSGTSFSTPLTSGEAALIRAADPDSRTVRNTIENTALNVNPSNPQFVGLLGKGRIRPLEALIKIVTDALINPVVDEKSKIMLVNQGIEPTAAGTAETSVTGLVQEFRVAAAGLTPRSAYSLIVDGIALPGSTLASDFGNLSIVMSNVAGVGVTPLPAALNPVSAITCVDVQNSLGQIVLRGCFNGGSGTGPKTTVKEVRLSGSSTQAGLARASVEPAVERLIIAAEGLAAGTYTIVVDGVVLGMVSVNAGFISRNYTSDGSSGNFLPSGLSPATNIQQVQILSSGGSPVLHGTFYTAQTVGVQLLVK